MFMLWGDDMNWAQRLFADIAEWDDRSNQVHLGGISNEPLIRILYEFFFNIFPPICIIFLLIFYIVYSLMSEPPVLFPVLEHNEEVHRSLEPRAPPRENRSVGGVFRQMLNILGTTLRIIKNTSRRTLP